MWSITIYSLFVQFKLLLSGRIKDAVSPWMLNERKKKFFFSSAIFRDSLFLSLWETPWNNRVTSVNGFISIALCKCSFDIEKRKDVHASLCWLWLMKMKDFVFFLLFYFEIHFMIWPMIDLIVSFSNVILNNIAQSRMLFLLLMYSFFGLTWATNTWERERERERERQTERETERQTGYYISNLWWEKKKPQGRVKERHFVLWRQNDLMASLPWKGNKSSVTNWPFT